MVRIFSVNNTPANVAEAIFTLKGVKKSAGWTVPKSSDGSTYNSSGDQITLAGSGAGGMDNARAWFVIQMPGSSCSFCLQRTSSTGANTSYQWRVKYSKGAGFTGGSPSASQVPSASDERVLLGAGTDASPTFSSFFLTATDGSYRYNCFANNASPYDFYSWAWTKSSGSLHHTFGIDPLVGAASGDTDPYVVHLTGSAAGLTPITFGLTGGQLSGWIGSTFFPQSGGYPWMAAGFPMISSGSGSSLWAIDGNQANIINGKDDLIPLTAIGYVTSTLPYYKGVLTVVRAIVPCGRHAGDLYSIDSSKDGVAANQYCVLPWDGSSTPLI